MSLIKSIGGKNVNLDFNKEFLTTFSDKIKSSDIKFINQTLANLHPSDIANLIENLSSETRAKLLEIEEFDIWKDSTKAKEMLQRTNGARTIPQIFIGTHYVGGNDQLQEANRSGKLDELLKD